MGASLAQPERLYLCNLSMLERIVRRPYRNAGDSGGR